VEPSHEGYESASVRLRKEDTWIYKPISSRVLCRGALRVKKIYDEGLGIFIDRWLAGLQSIMGVPMRTPNDCIGLVAKDGQPSQKNRAIEFVDYEKALFLFY